MINIFFNTVLLEAHTSYNNSLQVISVRSQQGCLVTVGTTVE